MRPPSLRFLELIPGSDYILNEEGWPEGFPMHHFSLRVPGRPDDVRVLLSEAERRGIIESYSYRGGSTVELSVQISSVASLAVIGSDGRPQELPRVTARVIAELRCLADGLATW